MLPIRYKGIHSICPIDQTIHLDMLFAASGTIERMADPHT